jgi:hypothetical protein
MECLLCAVRRTTANTALALLVVLAPARVRAEEPGAPASRPATIPALSRPGHATLALTERLARAALVAPKLAALEDQARRQRRSGRALLWVAAGWFGVAATLLGISFTPEKPCPGICWSEMAMVRVAAIGCMITSLGFVIPGGVFTSKASETTRAAEQLVRDVALGF